MLISGVPPAETIFGTLCARLLTVLTALLCIVPILAWDLITAASTQPAPGPVRAAPRPSIGAFRLDQLTAMS
jgi:hypothetical protein